METYSGIFWPTKPLQIYFITFSPIKKSFAFSYKLLTLVNTSIKSARGENLSVSKFSGDTNSESKRFQFDRGTLTKVLFKTCMFKGLDEPKKRQKYIKIYGKIKVVNQSIPS